MAKHTLLYFDFDFWRAEAPRLIMHVGGIEFEDKRFGHREEFAKLKAAGEFPFGSVPVLVIKDSDTTTTIAQSPAIMRYAGKLCGMYPDDPTAAALVDQVIDSANDATAKVMAAATPSAVETSSAEASASTSA